MEDKKIQSFVGSDSARENLKLVSKRSLKKLPSLKKNAFSGLFEGLEDALSKKHLGVIRRMLEKRWETVENLRHS